MNGHNGFDIRRRRQREVEALARHVGAADTEDFSHYLVAWLQARPAPGDRVFAVQNAARRMGRQIDHAQAFAIVAAARTMPRPRTPDGWAKILHLTYKKRQALGITTIGSIDVRKRQREELRKQEKKAREARRRRARGIKPRSQSLSHTKPWNALGISRRTWYRRQKTAQTTATAPNGTNTCPAIAPRPARVSDQQPWSPCASTSLHGTEL
jgi:hypothetical protein